MTSPPVDWKQLCAELVEAWQKGNDIVGPMNRARTTLAQPEPADLSGVSWPDPGPITARARVDGKWYLLDTQPEPEPEPEREAGELAEDLQLEDELDDD
jgi:hypothetical protein